MRHLPAFFVILALAVPAAADVVHLRDGRTLEGKLKRAGSNGWTVTADGRKPTTVRDDDVARIELTGRPTTSPAVAAGRLASLRRATATLDDAADGLARFRRFVDGGADPDTLTAARRDLAVWQDRVDRHLTRLGDRWVPPAVLDQAVGDAMVTADHARRAVAEGRFADAEPLVNAALAVDPKNASAHYLLGLLRVQQNQLTAARQAFEAAAALVPNHGPTLNNLAVIDYLQHRYADALARYDEAMIAGPGNSAVLDNVAAFAAADDVPKVFARSPAAKRVGDRYTAQSKDLADRMAKAGMQRFGSAWLNPAELADVRRHQDDDRRELDKLTEEFDRRQDQVRQTDLAIADVESRQRGSGRVGSYLSSYDGRGNGNSSVFYELQNDADQLQRRRATQVAKLDDVQKQAAALRRRILGEPDGLQKLIGPEATPVRLPH